MAIKCEICNGTVWYLDAFFNSEVISSDFNWEKKSRILVNSLELKIQLNLRKLKSTWSFKRIQENSQEFKGIQFKSGNSNEFQKT